MRFYLDIEVEKGELPIEIRRVVLSMIKESLTDVADGRFYDKYYSSNIPKDFSFSVYLRGSIFTKEKIELPSKSFKIYFTTDDKNKAGLILINSFLMKRNKIFPLRNNNSLKIRNVFQINQDLIFSTKIIVRTFAGGSIVVREHNHESNLDRYYTVEDNVYNEKLTDIVKIQARLAGFSEEDVLNISVKALDDCKKVVVKHYGSFVDCTVGSFVISANTEILQYLYDAGLGSRSSAGFGMLNLVSQLSSDE